MTQQSKYETVLQCNRRELDDALVYLWQHSTGQLKSSRRWRTSATISVAPGRIGKDRRGYRGNQEAGSGIPMDTPLADYDVSNDARRFVFPKYKPTSSNVPRARVILDWSLELMRVTTAGK